MGNFAVLLNRLGAIAESPSLSYTGRYIAYIIDDRGKPTIALYDRVNQQSVPITNWYASQVRNPNISPDGRFIKKNRELENSVSLDLG